jgi:hypothetical protein
MVKNLLKKDCLAENLVLAGKLNHSDERDWIFEDRSSKNSLYTVTFMEDTLSFSTAYHEDGPQGYIEKELDSDYCSALVSLLYESSEDARDCISKRKNI